MAFAISRNNKGYSGVNFRGIKAVIPPVFSSVISSSALLTHAREGRVFSEYFLPVLCVMTLSLHGLPNYKIRICHDIVITQCIAAYFMINTAIL